MEKLSFTLYEIFGYFLPGVIGVAAIAILFWTFFPPATPFPVGSIELNKLWYFGLLVVCYYAGHILQEISRWIFEVLLPHPDSSALDSKKTKSMPLIIRCAKNQLKSSLGLTGAEELDDKATVTLCDEIALQYGQLGDRDVFIYREGFYRGSVVSLLLLDIAFIGRLTSDKAVFLSTRWSPDNRCPWAFALVVVSCCIVAAWTRYKHFADLRAMRGVLTFVSLSSFQALGKKEDNKQ